MGQSAVFRKNVCTGLKSQFTAYRENPDIGHAGHGVRMVAYVCSFLQIELDRMARGVIPA